MPPLAISLPPAFCVVGLCPPRLEGACAPAPWSIVDVPFSKVSVKLADVTPNTMLVEMAFVLIDAFRSLLLRCDVIFSHGRIV